MTASQQTWSLFAGIFGVLVVASLIGGALHLRTAVQGPNPVEANLNARIRAWWSKLVFTGKGSAPKELHSGAEVVAAVSADPKLIGYVDKSFVDMTVKVIYTVK